MKPSEALDLVAIYEASYSRDVPDPTRNLWCSLFADVPREAGLNALNELAATTNFPPTPQRIRLLALELDAGITGFGDIWRELVEAAETCDYFDPNPPKALSAPAYALARQLGWADFRVSDPTDTYYVHQAQQRYAEVTERAQRRLTNGLPAFEPIPEVEALGDGIFGRLVEGIFGDGDD